MAALPRLICAIGLALPPTLASAAVTIDCPALDALPAIGFSYDADSLTITDPVGTATVPASLEKIDANMFGIRGSGPMQAQMPDPGALDACVAAGLKKQGVTAQDADMLGYFVSQCRVDLAASGSVQPVTARFEITALDPKQAMVFITRAYQAASPVTGAPLELAEFPTRDCTVTNAP